MITLVELKKYLEITNNSKDDLLNLIIKKAIWYAENYTMQVLQKPWSVITQISDNKDCKVFIQNYHNLEISKVYKNTWTDFSETFTEITDDWTYYLLDNIWVLNFKYSSNLNKAIKVEYYAWYKADWSETPEDLKGALLELCSVFFGIAGTWKEVRAETVDWDRIEFAITNGSDKEKISTSITDIFDKYKKYDFST